MEESSVHKPSGEFIPQRTAHNLLEAAKEAVILLREQKAAFGAGFRGDRQLDALVAAILEAEGS